MSGSSRSSRVSENWHPAAEYWIYMPAAASEYVPVEHRTSQNPRGLTRDRPWWLFDDRSRRGPNYGSPSFPPAPAPLPPHLSPFQLVIDDYDTYPRAESPVPPQTPPTFFTQTFSQDESRLSEEEQRQALGKLRKQLYHPHLSTIVKRLSNKSSTSIPQDDTDWKICAVCLEDFVPKQFLTTTPCGHMFHEDCIVPWVKSQGKCPVCRHMFIDEKTKNNATSSRRGAGINRDLLRLIY